MNKKLKKYINLPCQHRPAVSHMPYRPHRPDLTLDSTSSRRVEIVCLCFEHHFFHRNRKFSDSPNQQQRYKISIQHYKMQKKS